MDDCIFCKIVKGEIPGYTVYQDGNTLAFLDINPNTKGHTLVIPKNHAGNINDMDEGDVEAVFGAVKKVVGGLQTAIKPEGFNLVVNQGEVAGQVIDHFHCHIIPRYTDDGIEYSAKGANLSQEEFQELAKSVSGSIV